MINYDIVVKLRVALASIYWYKDDMVNLIQAYTNQWISYDYKKRSSKFDISSRVLQRLWEDQKYDDIITLANQVLKVKDFSHFEKIENGDTYKKRAIKSVDDLKIVMSEEKS